MDLPRRATACDGEPGPCLTGKSTAPRIRPNLNLIKTVATLLHIDSSPRRTSSITRRLTAEYVARWQETNPHGVVVHRDLAVSGLPTISAEWIAASLASGDVRTDAQKAELRLSDTLISELRLADEYIIGVPMHNFSPAALFHLWIEQIVRMGETVSITDGRPVGLLRGKRATFLVASAGSYEAGTPTAPLNFVEPYLRTIFGYIGITEVHFLSAGGVAGVFNGVVSEEEFLHPHLRAIRELFRTGRESCATA